MPYLRRRAELTAWKGQSDSHWICVGCGTSSVSTMRVQFSESSFTRPGGTNRFAKGRQPLERERRRVVSLMTKNAYQ